MNIEKGRYLIFVMLVLCCGMSCREVPTDHRIKLIIDADTANEVDDLYAIVRAAVDPTINLIAVNSAQFHISPLASDTSVIESQLMNEELMKLLHRKDVKLPMGSNEPLNDSSMSKASDASRQIIVEAHKIEDGDILHLVILGSCTNVASAIIEDPSIIPKVSVHYIGFWHDAETNTYDKVEFNSGNDTIAVDVLLNTAGLDFNVMTATTCQHLVFSRDEVDRHLENKGDLGQYLLDRWDTYDRWWTEEDPEKLQWIMWDVAIIEALIHPDLAVKEDFKTPPENINRTIEAYTKIDVQGMIDDYWNAIDIALSSN